MVEVLDGLASDQSMGYGHDAGNEFLQRLLRGWPSSRSHVQL